MWWYLPLGADVAVISDDFSCHVIDHATRLKRALKGCSALQGLLYKR